MTALAGGHEIRCDSPGCTAVATVEHDAWGFCADHATATAPKPTPPPLRAVTVPAAKPNATADKKPAAEPKPAPAKKPATQPLPTQLSTPQLGDLDRWLRELNQQLLKDQGYTAEHIRRVTA